MIVDNIQSVIWYGPYWILVDSGYLPQNTASIISLAKGAMLSLEKGDEYRNTQVYEWKSCFRSISMSTRADGTEEKQLTTIRSVHY